MGKIKKVMACEIKQVGEESDRILRFIGSDETPDRDRDIIEVAGWKCEEYMTNPVFLWAHDYSMPPVGKAVGVTKDLTSKRLVFDIKFPTLEELSSDIKNPSEHAKFVDTVYNLYKGGYMSATSVGFRGIKSKARDDDEMLDKPEWQRGRRYMEQSLMELSAVPVPSNPNALQQAKSAGIDTEAVEKSIVDGKMDSCPHTCCVMCDKDPCEQRIECCQGCMMCCKEMCEDCEKDCKMSCCALCQAEHQSVCGACSKTECSEHPDMKEMPKGQHALIRKAGATLSKKSKEMLNKVCDEMKECGDKLRKFIDGAGMEEEPMMTAETTMPMMEPMMSAMRTAIADELKQALDEMKSQVSLLLQKDAPKVIDLDAIEFPKATKDPEQIQLSIEPEELKRLIRETTQNLIQGGN